MSWQYGWNAQSAQMPDKKVQIKVSAKGNSKIQAELLAIKSKNNNQSQIKGAYSKPIANKQPKKNKGVQQRIKRDQQAHEMTIMTNSRSLSMIKQKLQKKQKVYKQSEINPKHHSEFLVDFVEKQLSKQDEQLQQLKKQFYAGRLKEVVAQQQKIHQQKQTYGLHNYMRENLAWQRQVLQQLNGETTDSNIKSKVAQAFDRRLTEEQKQALVKVIDERLRQKKRIQEMKSQRKQEELQRIRKIKKLDVLLSSSEDDQQE